MFGKKKRAPQPRGQGAAAAKQVNNTTKQTRFYLTTTTAADPVSGCFQMGLFVDLDPEEMMLGVEGNLDDPDLEAELAAITGNKAAAGGRTKPKGKSEWIYSSGGTMRGWELEVEVLFYLKETKELHLMKTSSAAPGSLQHTLEERAAMYRTALQNAKTAGETSKARRYDRGLKTLESMLAAVKKGRPVNEAEIPPPVATGAPSAAPRPVVPARPPPPVPLPPEPTQQEESSTTTLTLLLERQKEYKMAALRAKKEGDVEQAKRHYKTSKRFDAVIEALEKGQAIDLSGLPPSPGQAAGGSSAPVNEPSSEVTQPVAAAPAPAAPSPPKDVLEALEQRRAKYAEASTQAKASGDDRKARMHDRIAKQYQSAIRAHKAGRAVNFDELPAPPGFPPIPGQKATGGEQGFVAALEAASKLASTDTAENAEEDDEDEKEEEVGFQNSLCLLQSKPAVPEEPKKPTLDVPTAGPRQKRSPSASPDRTQLEFLEGRKKQYMKAALQAKQKNDMEQAKVFLRTAKGFDPMIEAARSGKTVDISTVPSPPGDEDEDFILVHHSDVQISEKAEQVYTQLAKILKEQYEKCMTHSKQFTHLGNVAETTKFEKMAESCKKSLEVLKLAQSRGLPPPKHHFEERSFRTVRIFPDLSSTDMVVVIVKGMNLPAPSGWIFCYFIDEIITSLSKILGFLNRFCPFTCLLLSEYNQSFTLSINRNHRGFRRVVASKGLKLELLHKGGFLRSDKPIGTALVKLDKLESQSEIREIVEVMDGRKATGGRVEVKVRLREPLSGQDMQSSTERWLVIDPSQVNTQTSLLHMTVGASVLSPGWNKANSI
uniref:DM14 domain-containing protein n=1 Tax=Amphiprion ocellaris TaxID=80972 RepID=A0AAQ5ZNG7_AMPOC